MTITQNGMLTHFPKVSRDLVEYARDTVFLQSRYIFVWRDGRKQMAYCTHCKEEYQIGEGKQYVKHNEKKTCPHCSSKCIVKSNGRGRSTLIDDGYLVWYEKSLINPNAIVATWYYTERNYSVDYRKVETEFKQRALYLFEPGHGGRMLKMDWNGQFKEMKKVGSLSLGSFWNYKPFYCSWESIERAVKSTVFQYSMWQVDKDGDPDLYNFLNFFDLAAKYPSIEYLLKFGFHKLVDHKLDGKLTYNAVYWRGKSIDKVLRIGRAEVRELRQIAGEIEPKSLYSYHFWHKRGWSISPIEAHYLRGFTSKSRLEELHEICEKYEVTLIEAMKYLVKQMKRPDAPKNHYSDTYVLTEWKDYIRSCNKLGIDVHERHYLFPNILHVEHDKAARKIKIKQDEQINQMIKSQLPGLAVFAFSKGEFFIRPAASSIELFDEGKALKHCVGSYADRYATGQTLIFLVRHATEPDTPFCTVEVNKDHIVQARSFRNSVPPDEVQAFLKLFEKKLRTVKRHLRKKSAA